MTEKIKTRMEEALKSDNWLSVYNLWTKDIQVRYYLEENFPDIASACRTVREANNKLIATIGEYFHHTPGGIEF